MEEIDRLRQILTTKGVTDVVISGFEFAQADFGEGLVEVESPFRSNRSMAATMIALALEAGSRLDIAKPIADFSLHGARYNAVLPQGVSDQPLLSIRVHPKRKVLLSHLVEAEMITQRQSDFLRGQLFQKKNILISGATSSGKTTLLGALLSELNERVVVLEQTPELLVQTPAVAMTERLANQEGAGAIELDYLVVNALRMRPDRIVVGEVRSKEFKVLLQAMNNGHRGTIATLHASSLSQIPERLEMLGVLSGLSIDITSRMVASSVDLFLQLENFNGRKLAAIGHPTIQAGRLGVRELQQ